MADHPSLVREVPTSSGGLRTLCRCPRCEVEQDILAYKPLSVVRKYEHALNGLMKCPVCKHVFSPKELSS